MLREHQEQSLLREQMEKVGELSDARTAARQGTRLKATCSVS